MSDGEEGSFIKTGYKGCFLRTIFGREDYIGDWVTFYSKCKTYKTGEVFERRAEEVFYEILPFYACITRSRE